MCTLSDAYLFLCLLEPVIECRVWNIVTNAERVDGNSIGLTLGFVEEPQSFKIFFAKHNLSSFKFSTKVCERDMLVNTPILEAYLIFSIDHPLTGNKMDSSLHCALQIFGISYFSSKNELRVSISLFSIKSSSSLVNKGIPKFLT